jgi:eukaryotic-like serine/threonine-protein kinase
MDAPLPPQIGRYRVTRELGRGAMGMVYQAEDPDIGRAVAIKLVRADLLQGRDRDEFLTRFRHEARAAGRCTHPNIVALYDLAQHEGNPYLAMEYVNGIDLAQALRKRGQFTPAEAAATITQVLNALGAAHAAGIVHRDVKPANILLQSNGHVKVTDFGISHLSTSELTQHGVVLGTLTYMSPEQCCGEDIDLRSDLFSVGTVLYELLSGSRAFQGRNANEVAHRLLLAAPQDLATLVPGLPEELVQVVRKSMEKSRDSRYRSAQEMADELRSAVGQGPPASAPSSEAKTIARMPRAIAEPPAPAQIDDAALKRIERRLAFHIGPIARHVIREAARKAVSVEALCEAVSQHIGPDDERKQFLAEIMPSEPRRADTPTEPPLDPAPAEATGGTAPGGTISVEQVERAERALASVLGPIARMMVRRALPGISSEAALWERLATYIEDASDRGEFLRHKARRPSGKTGQ